MLDNTPEQFAAQLREGHYNELRVALYFMLTGAHVRIGYTGQRYDLHVLPTSGQPGFAVEVKWDKASAKTGNLYFETENTRQNRPSGIAATSADWWCQVLGEGNAALLAPTADLRTMLARGRFRQLETRARDSNSRGVIVPRVRLEAEPWVRAINLPGVEEFFGRLFRGSEQKRA